MVLSSEISFGLKNGTFAPYFNAAFFILFKSVETYVSENIFDFKAL